MSRLGYRLLRWAGVAVGIAAIPLTLHANSVTIFNTFGPGHSSDCCFGFSEAGSNVPPYTSVAMAFTPSTISTLFAIDVAIAFNSAGSNQFALALMTDNSGQPGSIIENWSLSSTFPSATCGHCFETVFSTQHPVLQAGTQYWLVPFPSSDFDGDWQMNVVGALGTTAFSLDGGKTWTPQANGNIGAFDVRSNTTVPEPSTLVLLGSGLLGIAAAARRKLLKTAQL